MAERRGGGASLRACRSSLQATRAPSLKSRLRSGKDNNPAKRGATLPPVPLCANTGEVVGDIVGSYGRDI
jgi:hypothetical protein